MEKPLYPSPYMRITQGYMMGTHQDSYAIDEAGSDSGIDYINAPFTGVIKKIYTADANEVWLESSEPVIYPDGTVDYMTILFAHDNDVSDLFVGKVINRGERFYEEGTAGNASGNHVHIECGRGKFTGSGWHQNSAGYWSINNGKNPTECLWIDDSITVLNNYGYTFKKIESETTTSNETVETNTTTEEEQVIENDTTEEVVEEITDNETDNIDNSNTNTNTESTTDDTNSNTTEVVSPKLIFTCTSDDTYAIELKAGQKLYLE